jgi:hypothetical protein
VDGAVVSHVNPQGAVIGVNGPPQTFRYTRQVGDTATIVINAAKGFNARPTTSYNVQVTMADATSILAPTVPTATLTLTQFTMILTSPPSAGDIFMFTVEGLT